MRELRLTRTRQLLTSSCSTSVPGSGVARLERLDVGLDLSASGTSPRRAAGDGAVGVHQHEVRDTQVSPYALAAVPVGLSAITGNGQSSLFSHADGG